MGGIGKTALAIVFAHRVKQFFPGGQIILNLYSVDSVTPELAAHEAMRRIIHSFHPGRKLPDSLDELQPIYRSVLSEAGRVIIILDNANITQVRALLPSADCLLIVTSRDHFTLPELVPIKLECLKSEESRELLLRLSPRISGFENEAADLCANLPLALEVFASMVNDKSLTNVSELIERIRTRKETLQSVYAVFDVSRETLSTEVQKAWFKLAVFPSSFNLRAATAVWGLPNSEPGCLKIGETYMQELVNASLVSYDSSLERFSIHDIARKYCDEKLDDDSRIDGISNYCSHYGEVANELIAIFKKGGADNQGLLEFDREVDNFQMLYEFLEGVSEGGASSVFGQSVRADEESARASLVSFVGAMGQVASLRLPIHEHLRWLTARLKFARLLKDRVAECSALVNMGLAKSECGNFEEALELLNQVLPLTLEIEDPNSEVAAQNNLGLTFLGLGEARKAVECWEQALAIAHEGDDRCIEGRVLGNLGLAHAFLGDMERALRFHSDALEFAIQSGDLLLVCELRIDLGSAYRRFGQLDLAIEELETAIELARAIRYTRVEGIALGLLGYVHCDLGFPEKAIRLLNESLSIVREREDRSSEAMAICGLGNCNLKLGLLDEAFNNYNNSLEIYKSIGNLHGEAEVLANLGLVLSENGDSFAAIDHFQRALSYFQRSGSRRDESSALGNIAMIYGKIGDALSSAHFAELALIISREIGDQRQTGIHQWCYAVAVGAMGDDELAFANAEAAINILDAIGDPAGEAIRVQLSRLGF